MGKRLNKKGVKYASDEVCKACNLIIKGDAFYCFDCKNSIHATCTGLSRETKLLMPTILCYKQNIFMSRASKKKINTMKQ